MLWSMPMKSDSLLGDFDSVPAAIVPHSPVVSSFSDLYFNPLNLAWAGGIIDGEGCIHIKADRVTPAAKQRSTCYALLLLVTMVEEATIKELHTMFGVGRVFCHTPKGCRKVWRWQCYPRDAIYVLCLVLPFLRNKKAQALLAFEFFDLGTSRRGRQRIDPDLLAAREVLYWKMRAAKRE